MTRKYQFASLLDGQVFKHAGKLWIKCYECDKYNAVMLNKSHVGVMFADTCHVELPLNTEPTDWDLVDDEAVLREIPGYKENF